MSPSSGRSIAIVTVARVGATAAAPSSNASSAASAAGDGRNGRGGGWGGGGGCFLSSFGDGAHVPGGAAPLPFRRPPPLRTSAYRMPSRGSVCPPGGSRCLSKRWHQHLWEDGHLPAP